MADESRQADSPGLSEPNDGPPRSRRTRWSVTWAILFGTPTVFLAHNRLDGLAAWLVSGLGVAAGALFGWCVLEEDRRDDWPKSIPGWAAVCLGTLLFLVVLFFKAERILQR